MNLFGSNLNQAFLGGVTEAGVVQDYSRMRNSIAPSPEDTPLSALAQQLIRVNEMRKRIGDLVDRLAGPQPARTEPGETQQRYGGVIGALEGEAQTLRRNLDAISHDLSVIEKVLA